MSFPSKADREKCWGSRDELWKCLDENKGSSEACAKFREMYEKSCPAQWVKHFDRKREYLKFKDRIQEGYEPLNEPPKAPKSNKDRSSKSDWNSSSSNQASNRSLSSCNSVADHDDGDKGGRRIIGLDTPETHPHLPTTTMAAGDGITLEIVGTSTSSSHHHKPNHLSVQHHDESSSSADCKPTVVTKTSPRIFRKFQPQTFT